MASLLEADLICAVVLVGKGRSVRGVARELGVDESTLRYRLKRRFEGAVDGRSKQVEACEPYWAVIEAWICRQPWNEEGKRPEAVKVLYESLVAEHGYSGSYKAVLRFVRRRAPVPPVRPLRRVETQPGAQAQVDWAKRKIFVHDLGGLVQLPVFLLVLSHSRMPALSVFTDETQPSWLEAHNRSLAFLGGVPFSIRIDNLKTGVKSGAGAWAVLNDSYRSYAEQLGFLINPTGPRQAREKGKVERRVRDVIGPLLRTGERLVSLQDLNAALRERSLRRAGKLVNPVTGDSVLDTGRTAGTAAAAAEPSHALRRAGQQAGVQGLPGAFRGPRVRRAFPACGPGGAGSWGARQGTGVRRSQAAHRVPAEHQGQAAHRPGLLRGRW
jgi:transposase